MKKGSLLKMVVAVVVIFGGLATYFFLQPAPPQPEPARVQAPPLPPSPPPPPPEPEVRQVIEVPPAPVPLPALGESDKLMLDALSGLVGNESLMKVFLTERVIRRIVATIDNLPRRHAPMSVMPVERAPGQFIATGTEEDLTIGPRNAARYRPYVKIAQVIDAEKLVELYVRLYPLFQSAYEELGYPGKYFNDRLLAVIDNLLTTPDIKAPVELVRPNVFYLFADPDLEKRSIGQRILMRTGGKNEAVIKGKLRDIKRALLLRMREEKTGNAAASKGEQHG